MIQLYDYQARDKRLISLAFKKHRKVLFQASTGYGKTVVLCDIIKSFTQKNNKKALVLVNREELLTQTREMLIKMDVSSEGISADVNGLIHNTNTYVAMVETLDNRLKDDPNYIENIGLIIVDECHIQVFDKITDRFQDSLILGCTATPVLLKRVRFWKCELCHIEEESEGNCNFCNSELSEWSKPLAMSNFWDEIVIGEPIHKLIEKGSLVPEFPIVSPNSNLSTLEVSSSGDFTSKSLNEAFSEKESVVNVLDNYLEYCKGKKTIIFNSSTKINKIIYKQFKEKNINVRMFDTVNAKESGNRKELLKWYENTPDAVLLNVGTFTTGFDEDTIEACILNTDTLSLSLYLQMVGRAGRSTKRIYKDKFILIDCGSNIERHGLWSDPTRDWDRIFRKGIGEERPRRAMITGFDTCPECWMIFERGTSICPECGYEFPKPDPQNLPKNDVLALPIREIPPPNPKSILNFVKLKKENIHFGHKILLGQIKDMFVFYRVDRELYIRTKENGKLLKKIQELVRPTYFTLLKSDLEGSNRTLSNLENRAIRKLDKMYKL